MAPTSSSSDSDLSSVCYCSLCKKVVVQVEKELALEVNQKTPTPGSSLPKLISHEEGLIVLFQHILNIPVPPNICNTQIKSTRNNEESDSLSSESEWSSQIKFCQSCLTRLSHIHAIVDQLARIKQKAEIAYKLSKEVEVGGVGDPTNSVSSAAAVATRLPENERRQEFSDLRDAVYGGLKLLNSNSLLSIVENLSAKHKRPTLPAAPEHFIPTRVGSDGSSSNSKVLIMKGVPIRRCQLPMRLADGDVIVPDPGTTTTRPRRGRRAAVRRSTIKRKYACKLCPAKFAQPPQLKSHELVHTTGKAFKCPSCPKTFKQQRFLKGHLRRGICRSGPETEQTTLEKFKCPQCPATFKNSRRVNRHMLQVRAGAGDKPFQCPQSQCPGKFRTAWELKRHRQIHGGDKPFQCPRCPGKFRTAWELKRHSQVHSGDKPDKPFQCLRCPGKFRYASNLERHNRQVHSGEKTFK